jgi:hypothetical protein
MRQFLVNSIYQICDSLSHKVINNGYRSFVDPIPDDYNQRGLYIIFDPQIIRTNEIGNKIIRIGKNGPSNNRLSLHRQGKINNSIFRKHVDRALQIRDNIQHDEIPISNYIQSLNYLFLPIDDKENLKSIEETLIQILSNSTDPLNQIDPPHENWLGYTIGGEINPNIGTSHLWNVTHVNDYNNQKDYQPIIQTFNNLVNALP